MRTFIWVALFAAACSGGDKGGTDDSGSTSGDGGVGTVYHTTTKMMGSESEIDYTVEESHAPTRFVLRGNNETLTSLDTISLSGDEGTTTLTYHADFELTGAAKLGTPALPLVLKKLGDDVIEQIEDCLRAL